MEVEYIIVQAGGKGTRLMPLTTNRPKSLVPVKNKPILFHLFDKFPKKKFIIIGDYKFDVLDRYLEQYATVDYLLIHSEGIGNASGIDKALSFIPDNTSFMLIWSDLLLADNFSIDDKEAGCYIGTTNNFPCSWTFDEGILQKKPSNMRNGVAGCFLFNAKEQLKDIPSEGSFTKFLQDRNISLLQMDMGASQEVGTLSALKAVDTIENRCRPYNRITVKGENVIKEGLTPEADKLIDREIMWYKKVSELGFRGIPKIYNLKPLTMARIHGDNIFRVPLSENDKQKVVEKLVQRLDELHNLEEGKINYFDMEEDYYKKTMRRLRSIRNLIPFENKENIIINGKKCVNVFTHPEFLQCKVDRIISSGKFGIIHGDCTLTNTLVDKDLNIYFIDARGYFGKTDLIGDVYYDWAKVYYSLEGAFDQFNIRNFKLEIHDDAVSYNIGKSGWEHLTDYFLSLIPDCDTYRLKLIHAIIWLSLASHCSDDYDSLCLAFYNGLYLLNTLEEENV